MGYPDYYQPNVFYNYASFPTGGLWVPIRNCCKNSRGQCADVTPLLDKACSRAAVRYGEVVTTDPFNYFLDSNRDGLDDDNKFDDFGKGQFASGRLLCDPKGRSKQQQIKDAITEIIQENPIMLVERGV